MARVKWLNRALLVGPYLTLCTEEQEFRAVLRTLKLKDADTAPVHGSDQANATTHILTCADDDMACVVYLGDVSGRTDAQVCGLMAHEAVHVWEAFRDFIGETHPGEETMAYSIQGITEALVGEWMKRKQSGDAKG